MRRSSLLVLLLAACAPETDTTTTPFDGDDFARLVITSDVGDVAVHAAPDAQVAGTFSWKGDVAPDLRARLAGDTLLVFAICPEETRACVIDLDVMVPASTDVDATVSLGDLSVEGIDGVLDLTLIEGSATLTAIGGNTRISIEDGDLTLDGASGRLDLTLTDGDLVGAALSSPTFSLLGGKGDADLAFAEQPDLITVGLDKGDIGIAVPTGEYQITTDAPRGETSILGVINTDDAGSYVDLRTNRGDINISGL